MIAAIPRKQGKKWQPGGLAFDESGVPVATVDFDFDEVCRHLDGDSAAEASETDEKQNCHEVIRIFLRYISQGTPKEIGRRVQLAAYDLKELDGCRTQRQLAKRMRLSPGRVSQLLNAAKRDARKLGRYF